MQRANQMRTMLGAVVLAVMFLPSGCKSSKTATSIDSMVEQYIRLAVALGERDPDSLDFYFGPEGLVAESRRQPPKSADIAKQAASLGELVGKLDQGGMSAEGKRRAAFLQMQLNAMRLRAEMLSGATRPFDEEGKTLFGVDAGVDAGQQQRAETRKEIARMLGGSRNPAQAYSAFERQFVVSPDKVPAVMKAALQECRTATLQRVVMPVGERVEVEYVFHKPWSGFSRYLGGGHSVIQINMDFPHTVDQILTLACHEGYPGHHVFNTLRDQSLVQRDHEQEWQVQPTFSPQSLVSEAAASYAAEIVFTPEERLHVERDILFPLAGVDRSKAEQYLKVEGMVDSLDTATPGIARDYLDGRLEFVRAADALEHETLMEHGETLLLYLNEYRTYMLTYTVGRDMVRRIVEQGNPSTEVRWQRYVELMKRPVYSLTNY